MGLEAWTSGDVPYQISSSPVLARSYVDHILNWWSNSILTTAAKERKKKMYVLEFGAGHCKLGWHMANELSRRRKQDAESPCFGDSKTYHRHVSYSGQAGGRG